jgi:tripartite-type tricarboxylate transporter receptor subunit TctC
MGVQAQGAAYPNKPVRLVVGFAPGGAADYVARAMSDAMGKALGQTVIVENRAGATGNLGAEMVARSEPDGYTLVMCTISTAAINYSLWGARMTFKPEDLAAVGLAIRVPNVVFVPANSPYRSVSDLIAGAKANPGRLNYGSSGSGGSPHMTMEMFKLRSGTDLTHVPFRGAGPMLVEIVAGRLDAGCDNMPSCIGHIRDGRLRALAVTSNVRSAALPDVPTLAEAGLPGPSIAVLGGLFAARATPPEVLAVLGAAVDQALVNPDLVGRFAASQTQILREPREAFAQRLRNEAPFWRQLVRDLDLRVE